MKVIKRDGRAVDYNREKIHIAISKANTEVKPKERASKEEIRAITDYIEKLGRKRLLVEDIQDLIEEQLMDFDHFELAKKYIIYRYNRALIRKQNTTDESILGLIKGNNLELTDEAINKSASIASMQRNLIAGEVSKDLTKRFLLPEKISNAHEEGILYFHDADYFLQPIVNCSMPNIEDMLANGTVLNETFMESPNSFRMACLQLSQIIITLASGQYGGQSIPISYLGKYLRKSKEGFEKQFFYNLSQGALEELVDKLLVEEISIGIHTLLTQLNMLSAINAQSFVTLFLYLEESDPYLAENTRIVQELLKQYSQGIKNENGDFSSLTRLKLVYVLAENNHFANGNFDYITKLAIGSTMKTGYPQYISAKKMKEYFHGNVFSPIGHRHFLVPWKNEDGSYQFAGRFNQGIVTINLPQIGIICGDDENKFWKLLDERLELCYEALMCRHYALIGTSSNISPIHWNFGGISRLEKDEKIDKMLNSNYSTISLGYIGLYELTKLVKGVSHTSPQGHDFAIKVLKHLHKTVDNWRKKSGVGFTLYATPSGNISHRLAMKDKEKYGIITDITDKEYYTNSYHISDNEDMEILQKLDFESEFQSLSLGGCISSIKINITTVQEREIEEIIRYLYDNILFSEFITTPSIE